MTLNEDEIVFVYCKYTCLNRLANTISLLQHQWMTSRLSHVRMMMGNSFVFISKDEEDKPLQLRRMAGNIDMNNGIPSNLISSSCLKMEGLKSLAS